MDMQAAHAEVLTRLAGVTAELEAAQAKVRRLETMRDGLQLAMDEFGAAQAAGGEQEQPDPETFRDVLEPDGHNVPDIPDSPPPGQAKSQADIAEWAMTSLSKTAKITSTNEVRACMKEAGYDRTYVQVRGYLKYLNDNGRIVHVGPGAWALPGNAPQVPQLDFAPAVPVAGAGTSSANGHARAGAH